WPVINQARGKHSGPLRPIYVRIKGNGPFADEGEKINFALGSPPPRKLLFRRPSEIPLFAISPPEHPNSLRILPLRVNLTADAVYKVAEVDLDFIARK
ncbi:uncharacterized protein M421DRAFT_400176, partial [Didymella exigua CBS 183.55]